MHHGVTGGWVALWVMTGVDIDLIAGIEMQNMIANTSMDGSAWLDPCAMQKNNKY